MGNVKTKLKKLYRKVEKFIPHRTEALPEGFDMKLSSAQYNRHSLLARYGPFTFRVARNRQTISFWTHFSIHYHGELLYSNGKWEAVTPDEMKRDIVAVLDDWLQLDTLNLSYVLDQEQKEKEAKEKKKQNELLARYHEEHRLNRFQMQKQTVQRYVDGE